MWRPRIPPGPSTALAGAEMVWLSRERCSYLADQMLPVQCKITVRSFGDAVAQLEVQVDPTAQAVPPGPELTA